MNEDQQLNISGKLLVQLIRRGHDGEHGRYSGPRVVYVVPTEAWFARGVHAALGRSFCLVAKESCRKICIYPCSVTPTVFSIRSTIRTPQVTKWSRVCSRVYVGLSFACPPQYRNSTSTKHYHLICYLLYTNMCALLVEFVQNMIHLISCVKRVK